MINTEPSPNSAARKERLFSVVDPCEVGFGADAAESAGLSNIEDLNRFFLPIGRADFRSKAKAVSVTIGEQKLIADVKEFSTGSLGWYLNGKTTIEIDGVPVSVQIGLNLTIVGSKELPQDKPIAPPSPAEQVA